MADESPASFASAMQEDSGDGLRAPPINDTVAEAEYETPLHPRTLAFERNSSENVALESNSTTLRLRGEDEIEDERNFISKEKAENLLVDVDMAEVEAEQEEIPLDDDSVEDQDAAELEDGAEEQMAERLNVVIKQEDDSEYHVKVIQKDGLVIDLTDEIRLPKPDDNWVPPKRNEKLKEKAFDDVDNPGNWL